LHRRRLDAERQRRDHQDDLKAATIWASTIRISRPSIWSIQTSR